MGHFEPPPEPPRGSVAKRLQHAIRRGDITLNTTPDNITMFLCVLLAPHFGQRASLTQAQHPTQPLTLWISEPKTTNTAPPGIDRPRLTDDGGLRHRMPSHPVWG